MVVLNTSPFAPVDQVDSGMDWMPGVSRAQAANIAYAIRTLLDLEVVYHGLKGTI